MKVTKSIWFHLIEFLPLFLPPPLVQTCLTAQNTLGVTAVSASSKDFMRAQLEAVLGDIGTDALKTGMIPSVELASVRELEPRTTDSLF